MSTSIEITCTCTEPKVTLRVEPMHFGDAFLKNEPPTMAAVIECENCNAGRAISADSHVLDRPGGQG